MNLLQTIQQTGRFPPVVLRISPLQTGKPFAITNFLSYGFEQSVLVPCDTFKFTSAAPDDMNPFQTYFQEGDIVQLFGNDQTIATGIIDTVDVETDSEFGEQITVTGRDLMSQLNDQDAISLDSTPLYPGNVTISALFSKLRVDTRIPGLRLQQATTKAYLCASEPNESKLTVLLRYLDPLNCLPWMDPDGTLVIGRPNMSQASKGTFVLNKAARICNVMNIKAVFAAATVPNIVVPIWAGQENVQARVGTSQCLVNALAGPNRLLQLGHRILKSVLVSNPQGSSAQDLSGVNSITVAGASNLLQAAAKREVARQNVKARSVQVTVPGHYNDDGTPFRIDSVYKIQYDRANLDELMYCYAVSYSFSEEASQKTNLFFCPLGTIVSDIVAPGTGGT